MDPDDSIENFEGDFYARACDRMKLGGRMCYITIGPPMRYVCFQVGSRVIDVLEQIAYLVAIDAGEYHDDR